ncbi:MAG: amidohydrolase family protein [Cyclobacteriaceae bacterium]|nr:amidohydrolase family protein [Cyclobacteriaceae bacterium]MCH8517331.1 amidohydrolase family protein [Cyclobacteriaceae bacterium]
MNQKFYFSLGLCLVLFCCVSNPSLAQNYIIHAGKVFFGDDRPIKDEMSIKVKNGGIIGVMDGYKTDEGFEVIDLKNQTVLPGLIDLHVHLETEYNRNTYLDRFTLNPEDIAFRAYHNGMTTLNSGFTSVRDLGGSGVNTALRNAINQGLVTGPRIYSAGKSLASTGGHADPTNSYRKDLMGMPGVQMGVVNGPAEAMAGVREQIKLGADVIKITATGGVLSVARDGSSPQFTQEELDALIGVATDMGIHVAAHAHGAEGMKRAIRAGVTTIEHGTLMDDETMKMMKEYGVYYVPTITAGRSVADSAKIRGFYSPLVTPKALEIGPKLQTTFSKAYKAGVKIAFGTDAGVFAHGKNYREFELMVEAGMPEKEALIAATSIAAEVLGEQDRLGKIEINFVADIIAVEGDPTENISTMAKAIFVMKDGKVYVKP